MYVFKNEDEADAIIQSLLANPEFANEEEAKLFIQAIDYCRRQSKRNLKTLAQTLESNIKTVFNSGHKYVYELLQNADDAGAQEVEIEIKNGALLFSHSGKHFGPRNVEKITDNAQTGGDKSDELGKTGYKGVGFKANFCISNKITVISRQVCFRFDEEHFSHETVKHPWPIIPIWTDREYLAGRGLNSLDPEKVHFFLENVDEAKVARELNEIFDSPEVLLLLRNVSKVTLKHEGLEIQRERIGNKTTLRKIKNGELIQEKNYLIFDEEIDIPFEERQNLQNLSPSECPEKLKNAEKVKITFAVELDANQKPVPSRHAKLFSYLPTDIVSGLPFWVNAEFLLKQDRGQLLDNSWNQFLMREIAKRQFKVLEQIAVDEGMKNRVVTLLPNPQVTNAQLTHFKYSYREGFTEGANEIACVPNIAGQLVKFPACYADQSRFFARDQGGFFVSPETMALFPELFNNDTVYIADHQLEGQDRLTQLCGDRVFKASDLLDKLEAYVRIIYPANKQAFKKLLTYLARINDYTSIERLKKMKWLPVGEHDFQFPEKCFLADAAQAGPAWQAQLDLINQDILPDDDKEKTLVENWLLNTLGAARINDVDVIRIHFAKLIEENKVDEVRSIDMLNFIYRTYLANKNNHAVLEILRKTGETFPIFIAGRPLHLNQCLMPDVLLDDNNRNAVKQLVQDKIPPAYFQVNSPEEKVARREFFLCMGAKTELDFKFYRTLDGNGFTGFRGVVRDYVNFCKAKYPGVKSFFEAAKHNVYNFIDCDFIDKISLPGYEEIFWELLLKHEERVFSASYETPGVGAVNYKLPSFIQYYIQNKTPLKSKNVRGSFNSTQLFPPQFLEEFPGFPFPVADIPKTVPERILRRLGFKMELSLKDCLDLLINPIYQQAPEYLKKIYQAILIAYPLSTKEQRNQFDNGVKKIMLLSGSGEPVMRGQLKWDDEDNERGDSNSFLQTCGLSYAEQQQLAEILHIDAVSKHKEFNSLDVTELADAVRENEIKEQLIMTTLSFLHVATLMTAKQRGLQTANKIEIDKIAEIYFQKLLNLKLCVCDQLNFSFDKLTISIQEDSFDKSSQVYKKDGVIFFTEEAFEDLSPKLIKAIADVLFDNEDLKTSFREYVDKNTRIRSQELILKNKFGDLVKELKDFFVKQFPRLSPGIISADDSASISFDLESLQDNGAGSCSTPPTSPGKTPLFFDPPVSPIAPVGGPAEAGPSDTPGQKELPAPRSNLPESRGKASGEAKKPKSSPDFFASGGGGNRGGNTTRGSGNKDKEDNEETGRKGEDLFYRFLLKSAKEKFSSSDFSDTPTGFKVQDASGNIFLQVAWLNKSGEQRQRRDIVVRFQGKDYVFEVKTTTGTDMHAFISSAEVEEMKNKKENYALVFVTDVNGGNPQHSIKWNPHRAIAQGILQLIPKTYEIYSPPGAVAQVVPGDADLGPEQPDVVPQCLVQ